VTRERVVRRTRHIHLLPSAPPHFSSSQVIQAINGRTSLASALVSREGGERRSEAGIVAPGRFACSNGNVPRQPMDKVSTRTSGKHSGAGASTRQPHPAPAAHRG
jgi:REP element-mobilizing transposase RayT